MEDERPAGELSVDTTEGEVDCTKLGDIEVPSWLVEVLINPEELGLTMTLGWDETVSLVGAEPGPGLDGFVDWLGVGVETVSDDMLLDNTGLGTSDVDCTGSVVGGEGVCEGTVDGRDDDELGDSAWTCSSNTLSYVKPLLGTRIATVALTTEPDGWLNGTVPERVCCPSSRTTQSA